MNVRKEVKLCVEIPLSFSLFPDLRIWGRVTEGMEDAHNHNKQKKKKSELS